MSSTISSPLPSMTPAAAALSMTSQPKPTKAADAAQQFEALLIGQMLRSVHEASQDDDDDQTSATMLDVADQKFAQLLSKNGGFGLAHMITTGLNKDQSKE